MQRALPCLPLPLSAVSGNPLPVEAPQEGQGAQHGQVFLQCLAKTIPRIEDNAGHSRTLRLVDSLVEVLKVITKGSRP